MSTALQIRQAVEHAATIVITAHKSPDGDSIGCSVALYHILLSMGKEVKIAHPDPAPGFLMWLPGAESVLNFEQHRQQVIEALDKSDLIFCLDYNDPSRVGEDMQPFLEAARAEKVMIDHHLFPADFCKYVISEPEVCSTAQLIYSWAKESGLGEHVGIPAATAIYLGIMTDSGSFRFPSVTAQTHRIVADLIDLGINHSNIHENVYDTNTIDRLRLRGFALSEKLVCVNDFPVAYVSLTDEELTRFHYQKGDTEGLVNQVLSVQGVKMAVLFNEKDGKIKISFRAKGDYEVNKLASEQFAGGGHKYASGGISSESMEETVRKFVTVLPQYVN